MLCRRDAYYTLTPHIVVLNTGGRTRKPEMSDDYMGMMLYYWTLEVLGRQL